MHIRAHTPEPHLSETNPNTPFTTPIVSVRDRRHALGRKLKRRRDRVDQIWKKSLWNCQQEICIIIAFPRIVRLLVSCLLLFSPPPFLMDLSIKSQLLAAGN
ncbi:hypothetical protein TNIN_325511 [Trichonephila inaurata madagascariensis]|uniref:Uncharacterized protein n=1 Tax=Trichonephila inaurata madagascariensis TaxID=2747483 RepID=A0A8X6XF96_9ARAC|nr:hypothetical protein TNIN_325511 [Trichonephila inaurata madagascariensis]